MIQFGFAFLGAVHRAWANLLRGAAAGLRPPEPKPPAGPLLPMEGCSHRARHLAYSLMGDESDGVSLTVHRCVCCGHLSIEPLAFRADVSRGMCAAMVDLHRAVEDVQRVTGQPLERGELVDALWRPALARGRREGTKA